MLSAKYDRLDYLSLLAPPEGCELSKAIGTTYSLDLGAAMGAIMALGSRIPSGGHEPFKNDIEIFTTLKKLRGRIGIYCEKGRILNNDGFGQLSYLIDPFLRQKVVRPKASNGKASFHPKIWVIEYRNHEKGEFLYRLIVLSRNLTFDASWDVAICIDGQSAGEDKGEDPKDDYWRKTTGRLIAFLNYLAKDPDGESDSIRDLALKMASALEGVRFELEGPGDVQSMELCPLLGGYGAKSEIDGLISPSSLPIFSEGASPNKKRYKRALIVSPFLGASPNSPIKRIADNTAGEIKLITREDELASSFESGAYADFLDRLKCYKVRYGEPDVDDPSLTDRQVRCYTQLHAKLYALEAVDEKAPTELYMGSLNASRNGIVNNVEFMVRLKIGKSFSGLVDDLVGSKESLFALIDQSKLLELAENNKDSDERQKAQVALDMDLHRFCKDFDFVSVSFEKRSDGTLDGFISYDAPDLGKMKSVRVRMLNTDAGVEITKLGEGEQPFHVDSPSRVSQFFVLEGQLNNQYFVHPADAMPKSSAVLRCPDYAFSFSDELQEERDKGAVEKIIRTSPDFAEYILFAFGWENDVSIRGASFMDKNSRADNARYFLSNEGLYEGLLMQFALAPKNFLRDIDLIKLLPKTLRGHFGDDDNLLESFKRVIDSFRKAAEERGMKDANER